jgi:hypothetical protein
MSHDRVGHLVVRVRSTSHEPELGPRAERFVRAVLERTGERLEALAPGRRFFIRHLPLRWSVSPQVLQGERELDVQVEKLSHELLARIPLCSGLWPTEHEALAFEDEAHWRAAHLSACARKAPKSSLSSPKHRQTHRPRS